MKRCFTSVVILLYSFYSNAQTDAQPQDGYGDSGVPDRITLVKNSMQIDKWHEDSFWPAYEKYENKDEKAIPFRIKQLERLACLDDKADALEAFDVALSVIIDRYDQINLWKQHFTEIAASNNGAIGLKFLQTETLLAMMDQAGIYEGAAGFARYKPISYGGVIVGRDRRRELVTSALIIDQDAKAVFLEVFDKYETERIDLLGDDYSVYDLYVGDPADFTPAFSKRLGRDFMEVMNREVKLKEKYLAEMARALDPATAAKFIALEDYQSIVAKMYLWSTADDEFMADGSR